MARQTRNTRSQANANAVETVTIEVPITNIPPQVYRGRRIDCTLRTGRRIEAAARIRRALEDRGLDARSNTAVVHYLLDQVADALRK